MKVTLVGDFPRDLKEVRIRRVLLYHRFNVYTDLDWTCPVVYFLEIDPSFFEITGMTPPFLCPPSENLASRASL